MNFVPPPLPLFILIPRQSTTSHSATVSHDSVRRKKAESRAGKIPWAGALSGRLAALRRVPRVCETRDHQPPTQPIPSTPPQARMTAQHDPRLVFPNLFPPASVSTASSSSHSSVQSSALASTSTVDTLLPQQGRPPSVQDHHSPTPTGARPSSAQAALQHARAMSDRGAPPSSPVELVRLPPTKAAELARFEVLETLGQSPLVLA